MNGSFNNRIHTPKDPSSLTADDISKYILNIKKEIDAGIFSDNEILLMQSALYDRYLDSKQVSFFLYHFLPLWADSIEVLFRDAEHPKIIELGCGTGASSLMFSMLGAQTIGIELDADLVSICNKRKNFYKEQIRSLDVDFVQSDVFDFSFESHAPVDSIFSLFAFNLMKPAEVLLTLVSKCLRPGGKLMIIDGNQSSFYKLLSPARKRPGVLPPRSMCEQLIKNGFKILKVQTHCAIPPVIFKIPIFRDLIVRAEQKIKPFRFYQNLGVSYTVVAEKEE